MADPPPYPGAPRWVKVFGIVAIALAVVLISLPGGRRTAEEPSQARHPIPMDEAVGYRALSCTSQSRIDEVLVAKHDRLFLLTNRHGDIAPPGHCGLGLYEDDTRMLSHYALRVFGEAASLLSSRSQNPFSLRVDLAITDEHFGGGAWDPTHSLHIRREIVLGDRLAERVVLTNFLSRPVEFWMELGVGCDFADIFEVRGWSREVRGDYFRPTITERSLDFSYRGLDGRLIRSGIHIADPPDEVTPRRVRWRFLLASNQPETLEWQVIPDRARADGPSKPPPGGPDGTARTPRPGSMIDPAPMRRVYRNWRAECTRWKSDVAEFNTSIRQAVMDIRALHVPVEDGEVVAAGIPWFSTVFGRDSIITGLQALVVSPTIAREALLYLARHQGTREDPFTEEQPGKIMHELRRGELARARETPHLPYYGTVDATPLWLVLLHETWRWTGDEELVQSLLPNADRALRWIDEFGDLDGDGFVEYAGTSEKGLRNQGWKDSGDGVPYPDGGLPEGPIALVEVQGYVHDAKVRMAQLYRALGREERAAELADEAKALRAAIIERFWMEDLGTFALALDGRKQPVRTVTSNAAHLLWSRVPTPEQTRRMADLLLSDEMFTGWGIRTLGRSQKVYNPMSYHNGSVWPHDSAIAGFGLALAGHTKRMLPILEGMHDLAAVGAHAADGMPWGFE
jgi:glycogen debranching enzyme